MHHLREDPGIDMGVHADHPGGADEQCGVPGLPAGLRGAGHGVPAHVPVEQIRRGHRLTHRCLDADDIGERAVGGELRDLAEQLGHRGHRNRHGDQGPALGGPVQHPGQIGLGGVTVRACGRRAVGGAVVSERFASRGYRGAQHRPADQSQTEHAHGCFFHASQVDTPARADPAGPAVIWSTALVRD